MKTYKPQIRTKNFSSTPLRGSLGEFPMRAIVRLGSRTTIEEAYPKIPVGRPVVEINTVKAIENSRSKLLMKECFKRSNIIQTDWWTTANNYPYFHKYDAGIDPDGNNDDIISTRETLPYPILAKRVFGFKGHGMVKLDNQEELEEWLKNNSTDGYFFEEFKNFAKEYRCHCTQNECFMTWRKLRRADAENRWFFNSTNCNWVSEDHPLFDKPSNWDAIVEACVNATKAVGLDIAAVDVRVQSNNKATPEFIVLETNSGPALGDQGIGIYKQKLVELINKKITEFHE